MRRQWKCPECGHTKLIKLNSVFGTPDIHWRCTNYAGCYGWFGHKTIQALVDAAHNNRLNFEAGVRAGVVSARMADKITNLTSDANTVKIEPPDFEIPWDQLVKDRISARYNNEISKCECGAEKSNTTHAPYCPKFTPIRGSK